MTEEAADFQTYTHMLGRASWNPARTRAPLPASSRFGWRPRTAGDGGCASGGGSLAPGRGRLRGVRRAPARGPAAPPPSLGVGCAVCGAAGAAVGAPPPCAPHCSVRRELRAACYTHWAGRASASGKVRSLSGCASDQPPHGCSPTPNHFGEEARPSGSWCLGRGTRAEIAQSRAFPIPRPALATSAVDFPCPLATSDFALLAVAHRAL